MERKASNIFSQVYAFNRVYTCTKEYVGTAVKVGTKADFIQAAEEHSSTFCAGVHSTTVIASSVHYLGMYVLARHVIGPLTLLLSTFHPLNDCDSTHVYIMLTESTFLSVSKISILLL